MKKEEAYKHYSISCNSPWDFNKFIDKLYVDFESRTCSNCIYRKDEGTTQWCRKIGIIIALNFGCNHFVEKGRR